MKPVKSQAYFEKIHEQIAKKLNQSSESIYLAIAWLTDDKLFDILCEKAEEGVDIQLLIANNDINLNSGIDFSKLKGNGGEVHWIGKKFDYAPLMHNKFCIIDNAVLIFGSYNWTKKARTNHESITIIEGDENLVLDFNQEFFKIKNLSEQNPQESIPWKNIFLRLETLANTIQLEEEEDIQYQAGKLKSLVKKIDANELNGLIDVLNSCHVKEYTRTIFLIQEFTSKYKKLIVYQDPEIAALQLEIRSLEFQVTSIEDEKTDIEKLISNFNGRYNRELGGLITNILFLKQEAARRAADIDKNSHWKEEEFKEAHSDYENFNQNYKKFIKDPQPANLNSEEEKSLKMKYRQAAKLCHPDKVAEEQKEPAEKIFKELKEAYALNDLLQVSSILENLEKGIFKTRGESVTEKDRLRIILNNLMEVRKNLEKKLSELKGSDIYEKIIEIKDWDLYFTDRRSKLKTELENIRQVLIYERR